MVGGFKTFEDDCTVKVLLHDGIVEPISDVPIEVKSEIPPNEMRFSSIFLGV